MSAELSISDVISALLLTQLITSQLTTITNTVINLPSKLAYVKVLREVLEIPQKKAGTCMTPVAEAPSIALTDIRFGYNDAQNDNVLDNLTFFVQPGEHIAIVGPSGCGKSTIARLLSNLYTPVEGSVVISGVPINDWNPKTLFEHISIVSQEPFLFSMTLRDNIRCIKPSATDQEVNLAAQRACLTDFIQSLPAGLDTSVNEKGMNLSGGQRQRIALARAFLKAAPILVLDEATSALDNQTEQDILSALSLVMKGKTQVTIAHRLYLIKDADRILVMDKGRVVQEGTHDDLLDSGGLYRALWNTQRMEQNL